MYYHSPLSQAEQSTKEQCVNLSHSIYEVESYNFRKKQYFRPTSVDNALLASCLKYDNLISCIQTHHPLSHSIYEVESYNFRKKQYFRPTSVDNALLASCLKYDNLISCIQTHHPLGSLYGAFLAKHDKNLADSTFANSTLDTSLLFQAIFSKSKLENAYRQILRRKGRYKRLCDTLEKQTQISLIHKLYPLSEPITSPYNLPFLCIAYKDNGTIYDRILPFANDDKWSEEQAKQVCQKMRESTQIKGHFITLEALYDIEKLNANFTQQKQETMVIFSKLCKKQDELNPSFAYPCQNLESVHYATLRTYLSADGACQGGILLRHNKLCKKQDELNPSFAYPCQNLESVHYATLRTYLSADGACQGGILLRHKAEDDKERRELEARRQQECQKRQCCCVP